MSEGTASDKRRVDMVAAYRSTVTSDMWPRSYISDSRPGGREACMGICECMAACEDAQCPCLDAVCESEPYLAPPSLSGFWRHTWFGVLFSMLGNIQN